MIFKLRRAYPHIGCRTAALNAAPTRSQTQAGLFVPGTALLSAGITSDVIALATVYDGVRIANSVNFILTCIEGVCRALVMAAAGIGAILSSAFGQYRSAPGLLVVAVGSFILR